MRRAQDRARSARSRKNGARSATFKNSKARSATIESRALGARWECAREAGSFFYLVLILCDCTVCCICISEITFSLELCLVLIIHLLVTNLDRYKCGFLSHMYVNLYHAVRLNLKPTSDKFCSIIPSRRSPDINSPSDHREMCTDTNETLLVIRFGTYNCI